MAKGPTFLRSVAVSLGALALLFAAAFALYGAALDHAFVLDDETQIVENAAIQDWRNIPFLFLNSTNKVTGGERLQGIYYKPLMTTAFAGLWAIDGGNPAVFHGFQIAMHALNAWLLFLLLARFASRPIALTLALVFLAHPINCEVAIYSADLQDALYAAFGLGALLTATRPRPFRDEESGALRRGAVAGLGALVLASLLSKESGVLFAFSVGLWFWLKRRRELRAAAAALAVAGAAYVALRFGGAGLWSATGANWAQIGRATLGERLLSIPQILFHYASLFAWPDRLIVAQDWVVRRATLEEFWAPLGAVVVIAAGLAWTCAKLGRRGVFFGGMIAAGLALHCQIVPLDGTVADRWFLVPMLGLLGLGALAAERARLALAARAAGSTRRFVAGASLALAAIALVACALRARDRAVDWKDGYSLYANDVTLDPQNGLLQNNLGAELFRMGNPHAALERFRKATELSPHWTIPWNNLGAALEALGQLDAAETAYRASLDRGFYDVAFENYPKLLFKRGKRREAKQFIEAYGLRAMPRNPTLLALKEALKAD